MQRKRLEHTAKRTWLGSASRDAGDALPNHPGLVVPIGNPNLRQTEFRDNLLSGFLSTWETSRDFLTLKSFSDDSHGRYNNTYTMLIVLKDEKLVIQRSVYTLLDCVGDIGGLYDGLMILFGVFL